MTTDGDFCTTIWTYCTNCGTEVEDKDAVWRDCPHHNGTRIEHCPNCDVELSVCFTTSGSDQPDCDCWTKRGD